MALKKEALIDYMVEITATVETFKISFEPKAVCSGQNQYVGATGLSLVEATIDASFESLDDQILSSEMGLQRECVRVGDV